MTESERIEKFQREWELRKKISDEKAAKNQQIFTEIRNAWNTAYESGKKVDQSSKRNLEKYFESIQNRILEINDLAERCKFLLVEKRNCLANVIKYDIRKEGLLGEDYQIAIDKFIVPLFLQYKAELEFENSLPSEKKNGIINNSDLQKKNEIINYQPVEVVKTNQSKVLDKETAEKMALRISNAAEKAGYPPIIIQKVTQKISDAESEVSTDKDNTINQTQIKEKDVHIINEIEPKLPEGFAQIECSASKEEILDSFMSLAKTKNNHLKKYYMQENDVIEFVKKNFAIFNSTPSGKYFPINLTNRQKGRLRYFVTEFYTKYGFKDDVAKKYYALLLMYNFEQFKDDNLAILIGNMGVTKGPVERNKIPFPIPKKQ